MRLPKSIIKKYGISKKAWRIFKGQRTKRKTKKGKPRKTTTVRKMGRRGIFSTQSIFKYLRIAALVAPGAIRYTKLGGKPAEKIGNALIGYAGIWTNGEFKWDLLAKMWTPFVVTCLITHGIGKLNGIIRRL